MEARWRGLFDRGGWKPAKDKKGKISISSSGGRVKGRAGTDHLPDDPHDARPVLPASPAADEHRNDLKEVPRDHDSCESWSESKSAWLRWRREEAKRFSTTDH